MLSSMSVGIAHFKGFYQTMSTRTQEWLNNPETLKKSSKQYAHFDYRTDISKSKNYISNPQNIIHHSFYPFIHFEKITTKFSKDKGKYDKKRNICYAAHIDRCIFQYYSFLLNEKYNERLDAEDISKVPIAYRSNLHENNITSAKRAFNFIRTNDPCYIIIGDFSDFFDSLEHCYLKKQLCDLLNTPRLPDDLYAVYKNITRYSTWELDDILKLNNLANNSEDRKKLNCKKRVLNPNLYKKYRKHIKRNHNNYGIPQGSSISAVLANIYMLKTDKQVADFVHKLHGMYMRYSDDFIIIIPESPDFNPKTDILNILDSFKKTPNLDLQKEKTQIFKFQSSQIQDCKDIFPDINNSSKYINFLGFTFNGTEIRIRSKTIGKYYYRMYRKAKSISRCHGVTKNGKHISCKNLYVKYSIRGKHRGNFLTYVERSQKEFGENEAISRDTNHHMQKIRKALKSDL